MLELYLLRHGQTYHNIEKILAGHSNGELTEIGIEQAHLAGNFLKGIEFDCVYVSELKRAYHTFEIVKEFFPPTFTLVKEPLVKELNGGKFEGKHLAEMVRQARKTGTDVREIKDEGESFSDVFNRAVKFVNKLANEHLKKGKTSRVLVVSHGGFFMELFNALEFVCFGNKPVFNLKGGNCAVSKLFIMQKPQSEELTYVVSFRNNNDFIVKAGKESIKSLI